MIQTPKNDKYSHPNILRNFPDTFQALLVEIFDGTMTSVGLMREKLFERPCTGSLHFFSVCLTLNDTMSV